MIDRKNWKEEVLVRFSKKPVWRGVDCDEGWKSLICRLVDALDRTKVPYRIVQVKEKFGGLRFYLEEGPLRLDLLGPGRRVSMTGKPRKNAEIFKLISRAETRSFTICETCGKPGKPRKGVWIKTLCLRCHRARRKAEAAGR